MVCLECIETVECMSWVCMVRSESKLCEILLLLNMADTDCLYVEGCGVHEQC